MIENTQETDDFANKALKFLEARGYLKRNNSNAYVYISIVAIFIFSVIFGFLATQVQAGKFMSIDNSTCSSVCNNTNLNYCEAVKIPQCPSHTCNETFVCSINYNNLNITNST